jgi:hypothetical protein
MGAERNALGGSRGGFSTKINAGTNAEGLPIGVVVTTGQAHDVTAFPALMQEIDCDPEQMLGDKGYDSEAVRRDIEQRASAGRAGAGCDLPPGARSRSCTCSDRLAKPLARSWNRKAASRRPFDTKFGGEAAIRLPQTCGSSGRTSGRAR